MSKFSQVWDTKKIRAQKLVTDNELSKKESKKAISFTITSKRINCLAINLTKNMKNWYTGNKNTHKRNLSRHKFCKL